LRAIRQQVAAALDLVVQIERMSVVTMQDLYTFQPALAFAPRSTAG
jgi:hypothetical protein